MKTLRTAALVLSIAWTGCAGSANQVEDASSEVQDARSNPYAFHRSVAYTLLQTNQPMEATRLIRRMIDLKPDEVEPYCMLGRAYVDLQQLDSAERALRVALKKDDTSAEAHSLMGVLLDTQGRHAEAQAQHRRSIELAPKDAAYRNNIGFSLYLQGRYTRAIRAYKAALELDMAARRVHNNLGFAYSKVGDFGRAEQHFKLAGPAAQAANNLGFVYEDRGEHEQAYEHYLRAVKSDPLLVPARANLARVCKRLGRPVPEVKVERHIGDREPAGVEVSKVEVPADAAASTEVSP
jgi:Flp pilus assembly protein TadD